MSYLFFFKKSKPLQGFNIIFLFVFLYLAGCTHGHCPDPRTKNSPKVTKVWVYKYDQSKQCDKVEGIPVEKMLVDFKDMGVVVFESKKQYDGLTRIQACGAFTGLANMFYIKTDDLDKVTSRGFQKWDF